MSQTRAQQPEGQAASIVDLSALPLFAVGAADTPSPVAPPARAPSPQSPALPTVASSAPAGAHSGKIGPYHFADRA